MAYAPALIEVIFSAVYGLVLRPMPVEDESIASDRHKTVQEFQAAIREYLSHTESITLSMRAENDLERARQSIDYDGFQIGAYGKYDWQRQLEQVEAVYERTIVRRQVA